MRTLRLLVAALALVATIVHARGSASIINLENVPATTAAGRPASADQVREALQSAGAARGWQITPAGPGKAVGLLNVRGKHTVTTDITYGAGQYSIKYRDSTNMNYEPGNGGLIHPKYNMWVQTLVDDVRLRLGRQQ